MPSDPALCTRLFFGTHDRIIAARRQPGRDALAYNERHACRQGIVDLRVRRPAIPSFFQEQNLHQTLAIAQHGHVLSQGRVVTSGTARELAENAELREPYLG